jgi:uncharacterized membrane protein
MDEYAPPYIATGLGTPDTSVFNAPQAVVLDPPPKVTLAQARPWWRIWTGLDSEIHPPLYYIVLRIWMDCFGQSDYALRALSCLFGLAAALVLFDVVRLQYRASTALLAGALLLFSQQIDLSREARGYTMLLFVGLLCCRAMVWIERRGVSAGRLAVLALAVAAMELTHYFAAGYIVGLVLYACLRFAGRRRLAVIGSICAASLVCLLACVPLLLGRMHFGSDRIYPPPATTKAILAALVNVPTRLISWPTPDPHLYFIEIALLILVLVIPLITIKRSPAAQFWMLWAVCGLGLVVDFDLVRQTYMVAFPKYLFPAAPAICVLLAAQLAPRGRLARFIAPLYVALCFAAVWKILQAVAQTDVLLDPQNAQANQIYMAVLAVGLIGMALKNQWLPWLVTAVLLLMPLYSAMQYPMIYFWQFAWLAPIAAYLLMASTAPRGKACPWLAPLAGWAVVAWSLVNAGQWVAGGSTFIFKTDWRLVARMIDENTQPRDLVAFTSVPEFNPGLCYIVYRHYAPQSDRPVMFLKDQRPDAATLAELAHRHVWMLGGDVEFDTHRFFPGWTFSYPLRVSATSQIWQIFPPADFER